MSNSTDKRKFERYSCKIKTKFDNYEGDPEKILADNTIADRAIINIKEIRIANKTVKDVQLKVTHKLNYDLVFGDDFLKQFGNYSYNTETKKLTFEE